MGCCENGDELADSVRFGKFIKLFEELAVYEEGPCYMNFVV